MSDEMQKALAADREKLIGLGADPGPTLANVMGFTKTVAGYWCPGCHFQLTDEDVAFGQCSACGYPEDLLA